MVKYFLVGILVVGAIATVFYLGIFNRAPNQTKTLFSQTQQAVDKKEGLQNSVERTKESLNLVIETETDKLNNFKLNTKYYDAGEVWTGPYKGYRRTVAVSDPTGPGGPSAYLFATNDGKEYILDSQTLNPYTDYSDHQNLPNINWQKVKGVASLEEGAFSSLKLTPPFNIFLNGLLVDTKVYAKSDENFLVTDFSTLIPIESSDPNLKLYTVPLLHEIAPLDKYILGTTQVIGVDRNGLAFTFNLTRTPVIKDFESKKTVYDEAYRRAKETNNFEGMPQFPGIPSLRMAKDQIQGN